jgi:hypothetical protein
MITEEKVVLFNIRRACSSDLPNTPDSKTTLRGLVAAHMPQGAIIHLIVKNDPI